MNKGKYEFVRIKDKLTNQEGNMWWFRATSYRDVVEHTEKIFRPFMQSGYNSASKKSIDAVFKHGDVCCMQHTTDPAEIDSKTIKNGTVRAKHSKPLNGILRLKTYIYNLYI